ncbi:28S ribosomal protein S18b, mitochondrial-like [Acipenser oxyrinchus oxyrinchus]|uniref:Small ribosomal subunit protein mS40 n=1 Tax=Acipenser oxyrinchus oxyrinchus TaxID=40147 RepID=A0AAD8CFC2_ACIOX|nr:28S ribosomal protein S18b, mitochondrial-like [Acipenser oxyrinchus oxyrinchus]
MATPMQTMIRRLRVSNLILSAWQATHQAKHPVRLLAAPASRSFCTAPDQPTFDSISRYRERPWEYLESEEYIEKYGSQTVWADYRRNHKGGIPPEKTRKTCIRGDKISGNPCPVCRDPKLQVDYRNVKLLEQFISNHSGVIHDPTHTGVCMKQHKNLTRAIDAARDHGLLPFRVPFVEFKMEDYSNSHGAVTKTPPPSEAGQAGPWYSWYQWNQPPEKEIAKVRQVYHKYLKEEEPVAGQ